MGDSEDFLSSFCAAGDGLRVVDFIDGIVGGALVDNSVGDFVRRCMSGGERLIKIRKERECGRRLGVAVSAMKINSPEGPGRAAPAESSRP